ncbi:MAG TPA: hypothetical protein VF280_00055 [Burkholderiales bacterium]|jgi:ElaB/YqjD/DUF883 family membrane-anchored ribosome-binding protein
MNLANMANRVNEVAQRYQVPERLDTAKETISDLSGRMAERVSAAGQQAYQTAYRYARENPRASIASAVVAAMLVGGLLWYMFGDRKNPVQRRRPGNRVRAGTERRRRHRGARASAQ